MRRIDENRIKIDKKDDMLVDALIYASENIRMEKGAVSQLVDSTTVPGVRRVLATPDIHVGYGVPIGCVLGMSNAVIPAAVGYDINCGMRVITTPMDMGEVDVGQIANSLRRDIPLGEGKSNVSLGREQFEILLREGVRGLRKICRTDHRVWEFRDEGEEAEDIEKIEDNGSMEGDVGACSNRAIQRGMSQLGTLGGGNHFCEIQVVERVDNEAVAAAFGLRENQIVIMLHSGSRGFGHQVGGDYMKLAAKTTLDQCPNRELCYLPADSKKGRGYIGAMRAAANFAFCNRQLMTVLVRHNFRHFYGDMPMPIIYDVPHNMAKREEHDGEMLWVHRKGVTRAFPPSRIAGTKYADVGQPILIPGSMGTASYILVGTEGASESLYSVNHGAGRTMSRSQARGKRGRPGAISDEDFRKSMEGVLLIANNKASAKEEAPAAYKDIDEVIRVVVGAGLADVVARLRPLAVLKG